ncbi:hypothetical protein HY490_05710 [Candidatus Woesearchaeota archaeon]|nr:hypothetical protein [Candidatus Woesearchaeota archaeon]
MGSEANQAADKFENVRKLVEEKKYDDALKVFNTITEGELSFIARIKTGKFNFKQIHTNLRKAFDNYAKAKETQFTHAVISTSAIGSDLRDAQSDIETWAAELLLK